MDYILVSIVQQHGVYNMVFDVIVKDYILVSIVQQHGVYNMVFDVIVNITIRVIKTLRSLFK